MVKIFCPATESAGVRQERVALPRTKTVQAPHWPSPQPYLVPVRPSRLRRTESKDSPDAHSVLCSTPFTIRVMDGMLTAVNFIPIILTLAASPSASKRHFIWALTFIAITALGISRLHNFWWIVERKRLPRLSVAKIAAQRRTQQRDELGDSLARVSGPIFALASQFPRYFHVERPRIPFFGHQLFVLRRAAHL